MTSAFKGNGSSIEFQSCHDYDEDHEYVCFECNLVRDGKAESYLHDGNAWIDNPLDAIEHLRKHIEHGDMVPNNLIQHLQSVVKNRSFVHQSLMSPGRRFDGSLSGEREHAFHEQWRQEQDPSLGSSMIYSLTHSWGIEDLTTREVAIMSSLVTWLGTNVGFCFLENALRRCGYKIVKDSK